MALVLNTNVASLNSQKNLSRSQGRLNTAIQRLSSGLRINSAKDDAAGLAISNRMSAQIRGMNQAVRNASDGISLAQTAEGAMDEITNNLQRIRELAVQSANSTNSSSDRTALQAEVSQLISEIDRVAQETKFNSVSLLNGTFSSQAFQVGADQGQTISISSITSARTSAIGQANVATGTLVTRSAPLANGAVATSLGGSDLIVNGNAVGAVLNQGASGSNADAIATAIETADSTVTATIGSSSFNLGAWSDVSDAATNDDGVYSLVVEGVTIISVTDVGATGSTVTGADVQAAIDTTSVANALATAGVTFTGDVASGNLTLIKTDGSNLNITETQTIGTGGTPAISGNGYATVGAGTSGGSVEAYGTLTLTSESALVIAGTTSGNAGQVNATYATALTGTTVSNTDISTLSGANAAITSMDAALNTINSSRGNLGAYQNRFESVVSSLQTTSENLSAAKSRIMDADYASETANLTKASITQQAGVAMLAQANSLPQTILSLLG